MAAAKYPETQRRVQAQIDTIIGPDRRMANFLIKPAFNVRLRVA